MRKLICGALLCVAALAAFGQNRTIHGAGDPRLQSPQPSCTFDKMYIDDNSGTMYTASGYPCSWTLPASGLPGVSTDGSNGVNVAGQVAASKVNGIIYAAPALHCDGSTDDTTAFQAQVTAAETAGTVLMLPPNKTCVLTGTISITGTVLWQGNNDTLAWQPSSPLQSMVDGSVISRLEISGITFQGNANTVLGFLISGGTNSNVYFHNNTFTNILGCPANSVDWSMGQLYLNVAGNVKIRDNNFLASGCSNFWATSGASGFAVTNPLNPSYNWDISGNYVNNTYADFGFLLFNLFESTVHDNDIQNVILGGPNGNDDANSSGYGIAIYGGAICGLNTLASPSGMSRTSNVVTINFSGTCSPALVTGDHIRLTNSTSVGGTGFDGSYTVVTGGTTSATATLDTGVSLANDTGGGATAAYTPQLDTVHDNRVKNVAGMGVYMQGTSNSSVTANVFNQVCQSIVGGTLPCGFVSLNGNYRTSVGGNSGLGSNLDGVVSNGSIGVSVFGNNLASVTNYGLRLQGPDTSEAWFGNTVNGAHYDVLLDGASLSNVILGNALLAPSQTAIEITNGSGIIAANAMNGQSLTPSTGGIQNTAGGPLLFALNHVRSFRGNGIDIRTSAPLIGLNYVASGVGFGLTTGSASYAHVFGNYLWQQPNGFSDSGGTSNVFDSNYFNGSTTPYTSISGMAWGNHIKGGTSGVYPVGSCTLVSGTCTITTAEVLSTDNGAIWCTRGSTGANPGFPYVSSITAATSFVVTSTSATDTGNVACRIFH